MGEEVDLITVVKVTCRVAAGCLSCGPQLLTPKLHTFSVTSRQTSYTAFDGKFRLAGSARPERTNGVLQFPWDCNLISSGENVLGVPAIEWLLDYMLGSRQRSLLRAWPQHRHPEHRAAIEYGPQQEPHL